MTPVTRTERIDAPGGGSFAAHLALPDSGAGPGVLVLQEIFGVNEYIRTACARLAQLGYVAMAPDLYWRIEPGIELGSDDAALREAFGYAQRLDEQQAARDAVVALEHLRALPEVTGGRAGALGFCLGGTLAYLVAVEGDPDCAVSYYGSSVADALGDAPRIECPVIFHFGGADQYISREKIDAVGAVARQRAGWEFHVHEGAGHAFDNHTSPRFSQPEPAARAWELTRDFLARTLAVG